MEHWTKDYQEVVWFMQVLWNADILQTTEADITSIVDYLLNPRQFESEHQLWESMDSPTPDDSQFIDFVRQASQPGMTSDE